MNALKYDVVIPGNHDFDYGVDRLMELAEMADFPYICCNFKKEGKRVFPDHLVKEVCGVKIGFVGEEYADPYGAGRIRIVGE